MHSKQQIDYIFVLLYTERRLQHTIDTTLQMNYRYVYVENTQQLLTEQ